VESPSEAAESVNGELSEAQEVRNLYQQEREQEDQQQAGQETDTIEHPSDPTEHPSEPDSNQNRPTNGRGDPYPVMTNPGTGEEVPFPEGNLQQVPQEDRVEWNNMTRGAFIKQWYDNRYSTPDGGWEGYDIHHILPREYGGTNDFQNLVPLPRDLHQQVVTPW
jgi:hypothetical protein